MGNEWDAEAGLRLMLSGHVVPRLRPLGYRGRTRKFTIRRGPAVGEISLVRSVHSTRSRKEFTFDLRVLNGDEAIWVERVGAIAPEPADLWWTLDGQASVSHVGLAVATALERFACPAVAIVMEDPFPRHVPDHARSFVAEDPDYGMSIEERMERTQWADEQRKSAQSWQLDESLAKAASAEPLYRRLARGRLRRAYPNDPRSVEAYVNALAREDHPLDRVGIARALGFWPGATDVNEPLEEASDIDEDARVRWAARYALLMLGDR